MSKLKILTILVSINCVALVAVGVMSSSTTSSIQTASGQTKGVSINSSTLYGPAQPAPSTDALSIPPELPSDSEPPSNPTTTNKKVASQSTSAKSASTPAPTASQTPVSTNIQPATCGGGFTTQFLCLLNQYRASKNLSAVSGSSSLSSVALSHSQWMSSAGTFSHTGLNGSRLGERCSAAGITCRAENLATGPKSAQNLLDMWKNSSGHNANLLGGYTTVGLGISGSYITLLFN